MTSIGPALSDAVDALAAVPREPHTLATLADDALLDLMRLAADEVRLAQLHVSLLAGEIARRSSPELGSDGLAQRTGHRTPDELVRVTTGTRVADARAAVRVGASLVAAGCADVEPSGSAGDIAADVLAAAVLDGTVSVAVADAVRVGLGQPTEALSAEALNEAASTLLPQLSALDADRAAREARAVRDLLDLDGIADREEARRDQRSFRLGRRADGMGYAHWVLDPESFALVSDVYDRVTSPRRSGPRFDDEGHGNGDGLDDVDGAAADRTDVALADTRTTEQRASDVFIELLRQGVSADTSQLLADAPIGVRMIVAATSLHERMGRGFIEGHADAVSIATIERHACSAGTVTLTVDARAENAGQPLRLGRERRLFSRAQRLALAARDGGCRWPGCERPPSWCEAHHIEHWHRDQGRTDVESGILLCRHHHLLAHNNGWEIIRDGPRYLLVPPGGMRSDAVEMPSTSGALRDALRHARRDGAQGVERGAVRELASA